MSSRAWFLLWTAVWLLLVTTAVQAQSLRPYQTSPPDAVVVRAERIDCVEFTTVETDFEEQRALECQVSFYGTTEDGHRVSFPVYVYAKDYEQAELRATSKLHRQLMEGDRATTLFFQMLRKEETLL